MTVFLYAKETLLTVRLKGGKKLWRFQLLPAIQHISKVTKGLKKLHLYIMNKKETK
jgi:hypothetical protein